MALKWTAVYDETTSNIYRQYDEYVALYKNFDISARKNLNKPITRRFTFFASFDRPHSIRLINISLSCL